MIQIESGIICQLRKGCRLTDRPIMFLISMVLSMGIQTVLACNCEETEWPQYICPHEDKTVVIAGIHNVTTLGSYSSYKMMYERIFKEGHNNLTISYPNTFTMVTPSECSPTFLNATMYLIYGHTDRNGVLQSSSCNVELYDDEFLKESDIEEIVNILWGTSNRNCLGDS